MIAALLVVLGMTQQSDVEPILKIFKPVVIRGEPILVLASVKNRTDAPLELPTGAEWPAKGYLEWADERTPWTRCVNEMYADESGTGIDPRADVVEPLPTGLATLPPAGLLYAALMVDLREVCAVLRHRSTVRVRFVVPRPNGLPATSKAQQVRIVPGGRYDVGQSATSQSSDPRSVLAGYTLVGRTVPTCGASRETLDPAGYFEAERTGYEKEVGRMATFLRLHPDFPFADCVRFNRAVFLSRLSRFGEARSEFKRVSQSSRDRAVRERAVTALVILTTLDGRESGATDAGSH